MSVIVAKFGGTSLATTALIECAAEHILKLRLRGYQVVAVVSAMGDTTDRLDALAQAVHPDLPEREYAALLSSGELISSALLAMALLKKNLSAQSLSAWQAGIHTTGSQAKAKIQHIDAERFHQLLREDIVPVVTGFQGINIDGETTTLGRGGSDLTAVALAAALKAEACYIFTDVDGVYTADPRLYPDATRYQQLTAEDMLLLSESGAQVLQSRSVILAKRYGVNLRVLDMQGVCEGTLVTAT